MSCHNKHQSLSQILLQYIALTSYYLIIIINFSHTNWLFFDTDQTSTILIIRSLDSCKFGSKHANSTVLGISDKKVATRIERGTHSVLEAPHSVDQGLVSSKDPETAVVTTST